MFSKAKAPLIISISCVIIYFAVLVIQIYSPATFEKNHTEVLIGCEKLGKQAKELCIERVDVMANQSKQATKIKD
ncbi:hypothetical protein [Piscirickettsia salmonis]|uniref:hypothetical protein n=1 Tax=Piscirickettsia salmonis TaxID=1238 RepID=UPI0002DB4055|nr:hypothetical protein [Piscirickettsia salmonis]APS57732.1 hypothetical protein AVI52_11085 [Piscirickettsia salmonis]PEQ15267.1 hypothetical protein X973_13640 [Piscirickettsia salmonis]QGN76021.1 hypothetical protein Psal001_00189 [Piscirickettsia salmonis]QGN79584.1 hypothetical protein Psal002_00187 [Piscirickettsia salmonis]QGN83173.1 hypothetical protein Psal003_00186 [Piscirickettsia salmonis]